jgi:hypothetical protein
MRKLLCLRVKQGATMDKNYRRIDQLRAIALDCGFGNEDAKDFGKLSKTATWESMLETYGIPLPEENVDSVDSSVDTEDSD